jgi:uncharacterized protein
MIVDTGAWYAIADRSDRHHTAARDLFLAQAPRGRLVTTDLIVSETWTLLTAHLGPAAAVKFWAGLREVRIPVLTLELSDLEAAWHTVNAFSDQTFSFTDCSTFAIVERLGIDEAFAFDDHFLVYRFGVGRRRAFRRVPD